MFNFAVSFWRYDKLLMRLFYTLRVKVLLSDERSEEFKTLSLALSIK